MMPDYNMINNLPAGLRWIYDSSEIHLQLPSSVTETAAQRSEDIPAALTLETLIHLLKYSFIILPNSQTAKNTFLISCNM